MSDETIIEIQTVSEVVEVRDVVRVVTEGIQGPRGPAGSSGAGFVFTQSSPASEWIVNHNLGVKPVTEVFDTGGNAIEVQVLHVSNNQLRIYFTAAMAGTARCV